MALPIASPAIVSPAVVSPAGAGRVAALHWSGGAAGCVRSIIPGALSISRELSLSGLVGPGTWRPPTCVGNPGSNTPTAIVAPHSQMAHTLFRLSPALP